MHLTATDKQISLKYSNQQISTIQQELNEGFHIILHWLAGLQSHGTKVNW